MTRQIVKEGHLLKQGQYIANWRIRYFILYDDGSFIGYRQKPIAPSQYDEPLNNFTIKGCHIFKVDSPTHFIFIIRGLCPDREIERNFSAGNDHDRESWCNAIAIISRKMTLDDFDPIKLIGRGSWGKVMLSREKTTGSLYAIKILKKHVIISQNEVGHTLTESRVLRTTNHPFLVSLKYSFRDEERLCFVMEFAAGGELFYHLSQERKFCEDRTRFYAAEIVSALGYLHDQGIIYRDLKLENLLLDKDGHIKIADFGLCKDNIAFRDTTRTFCGTPEYLSPEVIEDNQYGRSVDWWSLGVLLYEMLCGSLPFSNRTTDILFREILLKPVCFPATLSDPAKHFLNGLLIKDPSKRLGGGPNDAKEIMIHAFFRGLDWQDLVDKKVTPPFIPQISSETDTRYFDRQFTAEPVNLTPIERHPSRMSGVEPSFFNQFSFAASESQSHF